MSLCPLIFVWSISCIYIANGTKYDNNRLIRHHHHNNLVHPKHQIHHYHDHHPRHHHHDGHKMMNGNKQNLYHHAKAVDYDKILEFMEMRDIFEEEMVPPTPANLVGAGSRYTLNLGHTAPLIAENPPTSGRLQIRYRNAALPAGVTYTAYANLNWHRHKEQIENGMVNNEEGVAVINLRDELVELLLQHVTVTVNPAENFQTTYQQSGAGAGNPSIVTQQGQDQCFNNLGSNTISSDLDFSYIRWDIPQHVVGMFINFCNAFRNIFGEWPPEAFEMNFYIATGFAADKHFNANNNRHYDQNQDPEAHNKNCYTDKVHGSPIAGLFSRVPGVAATTDYGTIILYELCGEYTNSKYKKHDKYLALYLIRKRSALAAFPPPNTRTIKKLIKFSEVFYYVLHLINTGRLEITDGVKLYVKSLRYYMNYYSDESYFSNAALQSQFKVPFSREDADHDQQIYLAVLDFFAFINRYAKSPDVRDAVDDTNGARKLYIFWQRSCKYIWRIGDLLQHVTDFTNGAPTGPFSGLPIINIRDQWLITIPRRRRTAPPPPAEIAGQNQGEHYKENLFGWAWTWSTKTFHIDGRNQKIRGDVARDDILNVAAPPGANAMVTEARRVWRALKGRWATFDELWANPSRGVIQSVYHKLDAFALGETANAKAALKRGMQLIKQNVVGVRDRSRAHNIPNNIVHLVRGDNLQIILPEGTNANNKYSHVTDRRYVNVWEEDVAKVKIPRVTRPKKIKEMLAT